jgi:predicted ATPase
LAKTSGWSSYHSDRYPDAATADTDAALKNAREIGQAATLMYALFTAIGMHIYIGNHSTANELADELGVLADEEQAVLWKAAALAYQGCVSVLTGNDTAGVHLISSGLTAWRATGASLWMPLYLPFLARARAALGQFDDAWSCLDEALGAAASESWWEAEVNRVSGEIALKSREPDAAKAEDYFERALEIARHQQAKSWELRAAMSLARLWLSQGKAHQACELLAPVYGWFTEGFDTRDLKEAKALLNELAA